MNKLPESLLLQILSRLNDSADVARCRVASKALYAVFPNLRSINLQCSWKWYINSISRVSNPSKPFKSVLLDLISKLKIVESVCISIESPSIDIIRDVDLQSYDFHLADEDFAKDWLPRVSDSLKLLTIHDLHGRQHPSSILPLISAYCHNLVNLNVKSTWLSMDNMNPMPMLTSLTLTFTTLEDEHLNELTKCCPNLQVLNLVCVRGPKDPKIHLLNLKTCFIGLYRTRSLTLVTPNLITLEIECLRLDALHLEAPMLSAFHLGICNVLCVFTVRKFENLKTLTLKSYSIGSILSKFPITKTVEYLTLDSRHKSRWDANDSKINPVKVFTVFPNVSSLCIKSAAWPKIEGCLNQQGWEILDGMKGLKTICVYLTLVDPLLTFSSVGFVLNQCVGLSEVSLLIHNDVVDTVSKSFMSKCMARWPGLKWRWGIWRDEKEDF